MMKPLLVAAALSMAALTPATAQTLSADQAREDLAALYSGLQQAHYDLFASTPRPVMDSAYDRLMDQLDGPVSQSALHRELQRFAALARHGHARIEGINAGFRSHVEAGGLVFPLDYRIRDGAVIVVGAPHASGLMPGDEILAINGEPNALWLGRVARNISAETPALAYSVLERMSPYAMWLEYGGLEQYRIAVHGPDGHREVTVPALDYDTYLAQPVADGGPDLSGRDARMMTNQIAYLRPGGFFNLDATTAAEYWDPAATDAFIDFVDTAFEAFLEAGAETLILDLRDNPGGNSSYSDPMLAWIADEPFRFYSEFRMRVSPQTTASNAARLEGVEPSKAGVSGVYAALFAAHENGEIVLFEQDHVQPRTRRFTGEVYALINRASYSNAVSVGTIIQDYGFGQIVGEATTDMATMYGAMEHFYLPNSGLQVGFPKAHIIRPSGEERLHPLTPDLAIEVPLFAEGDPMLEHLMEMIED